MDNVKKLSVDGFKWVENTPQFNKDFIENYNEDSNEGHFLEIDARYPEELYDLHNDLLEKTEKLVANLHDEKEYIMQIFFIVHRIIFFLVDRIIKFNQEAKSYIDMNTELRKNGQK